MNFSPRLLKKYRQKEIIVFDLDGTLAPTKSALDQDMVK